MGECYYIFDPEHIVIRLRTRRLEKRQGYRAPSSNSLSSDRGTHSRRVIDARRTPESRGVPRATAPKVYARVHTWTKALQSERCHQHHLDAGGPASHASGYTLIAIAAAPSTQARAMGWPHFWALMILLSCVHTTSIRKWNSAFQHELRSCHGGCGSVAGYFGPSTVCHGCSIIRRTLCSSTVSNILSRVSCRAYCVCSLRYALMRPQGRCCVWETTRLPTSSPTPKPLAAGH